MCVTNTTQRRQTISLPQQQASACPSMISQRLFGGEMPQMDFTAPRPAEKPRPKRRRKPQRPGLTAKNNERHFVVHNYHDHAMDPDENDVCEEHGRGGVAVAFPIKLHAVLDQVEADGYADVIS